MSDRILFDLAPGWALGFDPQQWMILKRIGKLEKANWNPIKFIGGNKAGLMGAMARCGIIPTPHAAELLGRLPHAFLDWKAQGFPMPVAPRMAA